MGAARGRTTLAQVDDHASPSSADSAGQASRSAPGNDSANGAGAPRGLPPGGGVMGDRIRAFDWSATPLGPIASWSPGLIAATALLLHSPTAMVLLWGPSGTMIHNDAYAAFAGSRHRDQLGAAVHAAWPEVVDFNTHVLRTCLAGGSLQYRNYPMRLNRDGVEQDVWMDLSYCPVFDESGRPEGVLTMVADTTAAVLAQARIAADHGRLAQLFEQAPTFMALLGGPEHRFELVNPGYRRLIGHREVLGQTVAASLPGAVEQGYVALLDEAYRSGRPYNANSAVYLVEPDAEGHVEQRVIDYVFQPIRDAAGTVTGIFVQGADVTDRAAIERDLRDSEARLRFLDELGERTVPLGDAGTIMAITTELIARHLGASRCTYADVDATGEEQGDGCTVGGGWVAPGGAPIGGRHRLRDLGPAAVALLRAGEPLVVGDARADMPATAPFEALGVRATVCIPLLRDGRLDALLAVHDASPRRWSPAEILVMRQAAMRSWALVERVRAEAALRDLNATLEARVEERAAAVRQGEQTIRTVFENSFMDQTLLSTTGELVYVNATALAGIAAVADAVIGRPFAETPWFAATPGAPDQVRGGIVRAAAGDNVRLHLALDLPTGQRVYDYSLRPAFDGAGTVVAIVSEAIEITARVRAEDALRQAQKMEAVGQLTGGLAHDFNNLLAAISGNLELLERRIAEGQVVGLARYIDGATQGARRAAALTQRLLAFARRQTLDPRPTDADRLIAGMTDLIRQSVGPAVTVEIATTEGLWPINVDASQLENALLNLCVNARDAMAPAGGPLTIHTDNVVLGERDVLRRDVVAGDYVRISVIDGGAGMPPEVIQRAFDPFFTTKPIGHGTGLGLSMVYGFARQSGGQVRIESVEGQGTTICLCLPRHHGTAAVAVDAGDPVASPEQGAGETVLVIDDEPVLRALIVEVLEEAGYRVLAAGDGAAGLRLLEGGARIDLLVTDVGLPGGMNGRQVADAARLSRPALRVLFITGYADVAAVGQPGAWGGLDPGMGVLTKPFPVAGLIAKVRDMID